MRYGSIYTITNKLSNKKYVGQTIFSVETRWKSHISTPSKSAIHKAIQKYGVENFIFEELCSATSESNLNFLEEFFIRKFKCYGSYGYNMTFGGDASVAKYTDEVRLKMRLAKLGKKRGKYNLKAKIKANQSGSNEINTALHAQRLEGETANAEHNPSTSPRQPSKYETLKLEIISLYQNTNSSYKVAKVLELDKSHVCRYLHKWGELHSQSQAAQKRNHSRKVLNVELISQIKTMKDAGNTVSSIAKVFNVNRKTIYKALEG